MGGATRRAAEEDADRPARVRSAAPRRMGGAMRRAAQEDPDRPPRVLSEARHRSDQWQLRECDLWDLWELRDLLEWLERLPPPPPHAGTWHFSMPMAGSSRVGFAIMPRTADRVPQ